MKRQPLIASHPDYKELEKEIWNIFDNSDTIGDAENKIHNYLSQKNDSYSYVHSPFGLPQTSIYHKMKPVIVIYFE